MRLPMILMAVFMVTTLMPAFGDNTTWTVDPMHSSVEFTIRHMMISNVRGQFDKVHSTVVYDGKVLEAASVDATIDASSINTHETKRDEHLRNADFFDVAKYPSITFKSKRIQRLGVGKFKLVGDLTMHGVTKEVVLDVEGPSPEIKDQHGHARTGASATASLNRKDFGLMWNGVLESGDVMVGNEVKVSIDVELVKEPAVKSFQPLARPARQDISCSQQRL